MHYHRVSVFLFLAAPSIADLVTPLAPLWDNMLVKHTWDAVPANWESIGHPPAGTTIDLHIALEPHRENALIDALYAVSDPSLPRHVLLSFFRSRQYSRVPYSVSDTVHTCPRSRSQS